MAPPFKVVDFDIMYGEGISKAGELIDLGVKANVIEKAGSWYSYGPTRIGQGREAARQYIKENPEVAEKIASAIRENSGTVADGMIGAAEAAAAE
jgi:recombination protein RecA